MSLINHKTLGLDSSWQFIRDPASDVVGDISGSSLATPVRPFRVIYAFGDSLSDAGNDYILSGGKLPVSPPYFPGHFTNGLTWVEDLALSQGLGPLAPSLSPQGVPNATDFAFGNAETGTTALHKATFGDLPSQLAQFQAAHPSPQPDALYTLSVGSVDLFDAISAFSSTPLKAVADIGAAVVNVDKFVTQIAAEGGKNFLVLTAPDLGETPAYRSEGPAASQAASGLSALFDAELVPTLRVIAAIDRLNMHIVDTYSLLDEGIANPDLFGLANVTDPVWTGNYTDPNSGILRTTSLAAQNQYLFWDQVHPTAAGHLILAGAAESSLFHIA
jgi:phospholipase/lecithinase/hemolysin